MTTEFGKMLRKLRIDCDENIRDMAFNLDITASYLSAIECGKRNIPKNLVDKVAKVYKLSNEQIKELKIAKDNSLKNVIINIDGVNPYNKNVALQLSKCIDTIDIESLIHNNNSSKVKTLLPLKSFENSPKSLRKNYIHPIMYDIFKVQNNCIYIDYNK